MSEPLHSTWDRDQRQVLSPEFRLEVINPLLFKPVWVTFFFYLQPNALLLLDLKHLLGLGDLKPCKILEIMSQNLGH